MSGSSLRSGSNKAKEMLGKDCVYKIAVSTADKKGASTDAKVVGYKFFSFQVLAGFPVAFIHDLISFCFSLSFLMISGP